MKNIKKIFGMIIFTLAFSIMSNVKADDYYYRINTLKSNEETLTYSYECQPDNHVWCTNYPVPEAIWNEYSVPTGEATIYLGQWYAGYTSQARDFSMILFGNVDTTKSYTVSLTSDYMNEQNTYTGTEINNGITITIGESFGTVTVKVTEQGTDNNIKYQKFNNDPFLPGDENIADPDTQTESFDTVYINFNGGKTQSYPSNPPYSEPEEDPEEKALMEALLNVIAPTGKIKLDTVDPTTTDANEALYDSLTTAAFIKQFNIGKYETYVMPKTNDNESATVTLSYRDYPNNKYTSFTKNIEIEYTEADNSISEKLQEIKDKLNHNYNYYRESYNNNFNIEDLESLNYYYNIQNTTNENASMYLMPSYSSEIHSLTDNLGFDFMFDPRAGGGMSLFYEPVIGPINILYNGIVIENVDPIGFTLSNILYIPSNTKKSDEAFKKAAQDRIDEYFPGKNITVTTSDENLIEELYEEEYSWYTYDEETQTEKLTPIIDLTKTNGKFYVIQIGEAMYPYFVVADSEKMNTPVTKSVDMNTSIKVETDSSDVPLDARINVNKLDKNSDKYKELAKKLNIVNNNSYDINVLSSSLGIYIETLENGNFKVYIPVDETTKKLDLVAAFVKEDGTVEEHEVKFEGNYAVFETNHFSTYSLVSKEEIPEETKEEPQEETYTADLDNIKLQFTDEEGHEFTVSIIDILSLSKEELAKITTEEEYNKTMEELNKNFKDEGKILGIYVIEVEDEDGNPKTEGKFQIKIKLTDELKKYTSFKLINLNEDDNTKGDVVKLTVEGDYLVGELPHLSVYILTGEEKTETKEETKTTNPTTGDKIMKYTAILGISIAGIAGLTIYTKKSKKSK